MKLRFLEDDTGTPCFISIAFEDFETIIEHGLTQNTDFFKETALKIYHKYPIETLDKQHETN